MIYTRTYWKNTCALFPNAAIPFFFLNQAEIHDREAPSGEEEEQPAPTPNVSRSPRQRRAQQRRNPASPGLIPIQQHTGDASNTGSTLLIVLLTLALAALIFRRIYLANDYIFDYEL